MSHEGFTGFSSPELPTPDQDFSVKDACVTNPDVVVEVKEGDGWIRLPVTLCELFINKDGPADITRTAKVKFPAEWGGENVARYVNGFKQSQPDTGNTGGIQATTEGGGDAAPYDECRIFMRDQYADKWQIVHYGYVGGVGPANDEGVYKFWCYDPADLMRGIQVSKSFGEPTIAQILNFVLEGTDENGQPVGINRRSVFSDIKPYIAGVQEVKQQKQDTRRLGFEPLGDEEVVTTIQPWETQMGAFQIDATDLVDDIFDFIAGTEVTQGLLGGQQRFQINRHNMVDLMNWFASEIGGKWHFEPTPNGPILFFDNTSAGATPEEPDGDIERRVFVEESIFDDEGENPPEVEDGAGPSGFTDKEVFSQVDTLDNDALADIKPFNTLYLYGETTTYRERHRQRYGAAGAAGAYTEEYPFVKLVYTPLKQRAGGYEYSAPPIESDKIYLDQAKGAAIEQFRKHMAEETEGTVTIKGDPHIIPFDYIRTIPACDGIWENAAANPITYEVNGVKHTRKAEGTYKTELGVSLVFSESDLEITAEYRES